MDIKDKLTVEFLAGIKEIESVLFLLNFYPYSFEEKGLAYFVKFIRGNSIVEFLFGPADWDIEIIIFTLKGKFTFKDLLQIPAIEEWVNINRYKQDNGRNVKNELLWFVELLKTILPIIE